MTKQHVVLECKGHFRERDMLHPDVSHRDTRNFLNPMTPYYVKIASGSPFQTPIFELLRILFRSYFILLWGSFQENKKGRVGWHSISWQMANKIVVPYFTATDQVHLVSFAPRYPQPQYIRIGYRFLNYSRSCYNLFI